MYSIYFNSLNDIDKIINIIYKFNHSHTEIDNIEQKKRSNAGQYCMDLIGLIKIFKVLYTTFEC